MSEFKPGDVALVVCNDGERRIALYYPHLGGPLWRFATGGMRDIEISDARRVVVIDPEDSHGAAIEIAQRVCSALNVMPGRDISAGIKAAQEAITYLANPTPRIVEPQGLGAVVEDADGKCWIHVDTPIGVDAWRRAGFACGSDGPGWTRFDEIKAARILSPGVTP